MCKILKAVVLVAALILLLPLSTKAAEKTEINELVNHAKELDKKTVTIEGEAIGEPMNRGSYTWVNVNDGTNAIGIWVEKSQAEKIAYYGNYKYTGDTLKITGVFARACITHGGEADIHSKTIEVIKKGHHTGVNVTIKRIIIAVILSIVALVNLWICQKKMKERKTNKALHNY